MKWPEKSEYQTNESSPLPQHIYLLLTHNSSPNFKLKFLENAHTFESNAGLNKADMYAFLYACSFQAKSRISKIMPYTNMLDYLSTNEQNILWNTAIQV